MRLFEKHNILTKDELESRYEINLENYNKVINIEALTALEMARQDIIPAVSKYIKLLSECAISKKKLGIPVDCSTEETLVSKLSDGLAHLYGELEALDYKVKRAHEITDALEAAKFYHNEILESMSVIRSLADEMEVYTAKEYWPFPSYGDLLFSIQE